ncbi:MAG: phenylalanine--tRNA ligase subunit alpha [Candidatus Hydrothermarchaeales archaeon]
MIEELHIHEKKVLVALGELQRATPEEIAGHAGLNLNSVMRVLYWLSPKGLIQIDDRYDEVADLEEEGEHYLEVGLPERRALNFLREKKEASIEDLHKVLDENEVKIAIGWLRKRDLATIEKGILVPTEKGLEGKKTDDERLLELLGGGTVLKSELSDDLKKALESLKNRQNVIKIEEKVFREVILTEEGKRLVDKGIVIGEEVTQLTHELLKSGEWRDASFRPYDIADMAPEALPAKLHPLRIMMDEIREIFLQMGFTEISGPMVESSFWNFDALFVPQDHPAREMQDTFYLEKPKGAKLPEQKVIKAIARAHEDGGVTDSVGWGYKWDESIAKQTLLRTHTTAVTIRHLEKNKKPPIKVFSIGPVFRNEKMTFKHIPEFYQIEGIVVGDVTFSDLLGILKVFYAKMGFEKIRFRPAFFPYTEPSLEVEVFFEEKNTWIELGGAGIFRPEVTEPLGITYPVLAWGLGLERLAMLRLDLTDIRAFYRSDIDWLRRLAVR